jgi:thiol-disulfide isomerase/thioredoxin
MRRFRLGAVLWIVGFGGFSAAVKTAVLRVPTSGTRFERQQEVPNFALHDPTGRRFELGDVTGRNRVVLVTFWASWCAPCRLELSHLEQLYRDKRARGFEILAVNEDEDRDAMNRYLTQTSLSFPVLLDRRGRLAHHFGVKGFPTTILIDRNRRVLQSSSGLELYLETLIEAHLRDGTAGG